MEYRVEFVQKCIATSSFLLLPIVQLLLVAIPLLLSTSLCEGVVQNIFGAEAACHGWFVPFSQTSIGRNIPFVQMGDSTSML